MMDKMQESTGEYGVKINVKKTKVMKVSKKPGLEEFTIFLEGNNEVKKRTLSNLGALLHRMNPVKKKFHRK